QAAVRRGGPGLVRPREPDDPLPRVRPLRSRARRALRSGDTARGPFGHTRQPGPRSGRAAAARCPGPGASAMKFLCVPCDSPMKLQTVSPPEGGSLSVVYACPECGYEMAMLTNAYEKQDVQSLGVRIGPDSAPADASAKAGGCPFTAMI